MLIPGQMREKGMVPADLSGYTTGLFNGFRQHRQVIRQPFSSGVPKYSDGILSSDGNHLPGVTRLSGVDDKIKAGIGDFLIAPLQIHKAAGKYSGFSSRSILLPLCGRWCKKGNRCLQRKMHTAIRRSHTVRAALEKRRRFSSLSPPAESGCRECRFRVRSTEQSGIIGVKIPFDPNIITWN